MSTESENHPLLTQPLTENEPEQKVLVPEEYIDDEKGKMNTIEVTHVFLCSSLVLCEPYEGNCWNWFFGPPVCLQPGSSPSFSRYVGRYRMWYYSFHRCVRNDDSRHISVS